MNHKNLLFFTFLLLFFTQCTIAQEQAGNSTCNPTIYQGIYGQVIWKEGNLMPTIGQPSNQNQGKPIVREIHIFPLISLNDVQQEGSFLQLDNLEAIQVVQSDANGCFEVALAVGNYSILTKEEDGFFANTFDGKMNLNPFEVKENSLTETMLIVDYQAAY